AADEPRALAAAAVHDAREPAPGGGLHQRRGGQGGAPDVAAEQVAVAVREQDQVARGQLDRRVLVRQASAAAALRQQVVDRDVLRLGQDVPRVGPAGRRVDAPRGGELGVEEDARL